MSTTVTRGQMFRATVSVDDERLAQMKKAPQAAAMALQHGADYWHTKVLPRHFEKEAHGKYGYANRDRSYRKAKRERPDLVNSGSLRHDLKAKASYKEMGGGGAGITVELRMTARVLNFVPNMSESSDDLFVNHPRRRGQRGFSNGTTTRGYPNLKREIRQITEDEREAVGAVCARSLEIAFGNTEGRESDD